MGNGLWMHERSHAVEVWCQQQIWTQSFIAPEYFHLARIENATGCRQTSKTSVAVAPETVVAVMRDALGLGGPAAGEGGEGGEGGGVRLPPPELATTRERAHVAGVLAQIRSERAEG